MNITGTGLDIVETGRIRQSLEQFGDRFLNRVFLPGEIAYCQGMKLPELHFAARFAGFEHGLKAQAGDFALVDPVIRAVGGDGQAGVECSLPDFAGAGEIAVRHVNVAAPFDADQAGLLDERDNFSGYKFAKRDGDEAGSNHDIKQVWQPVLG